MYTHQFKEIQTTLNATRPPRVWLITIGRDQTQSISSAGEVRQSLSIRYRLASTQHYLPIDPTYLQIKNWLLRRNSYEYRLTVEVYRRVS